MLRVEKNTDLAAQAHFGLAGIYRKQEKPRTPIVKWKNFVNCRATHPKRTIHQNS